MSFLELFAQSTVQQLLQSKFIIILRTSRAESVLDIYATGRPVEVRALFVMNRDQSALMQ